MKGLLEGRRKIGEGAKEINGKERGVGVIWEGVLNVFETL